MAWIRRAATNVVNWMQRLKRRRLTGKKPPTLGEWYHATNRVIGARFEKLPEAMAISCRENREPNTLRAELAKLKGSMGDARDSSALDRFDGVTAKATYALECILETGGQRFVQAYDEVMRKLIRDLPQAA